MSRDKKHEREMAQLQQLAAVVQERDAPDADPAVVAAAPDAIAIIANQMADQSKKKRK